MISLLHKYMLAMSHLGDYLTIFPHLLLVGIFALIKWTTIYSSNCEMSGKFITL